MTVEAGRFGGEGEALVNDGGTGGGAVVSAEVATASEAVSAAEATGANTPPVVSGEVALSTSEDTAIVITEAELLSLASDADGDVLSVVNLVAFGGTLFNIGNGTWLFTPGANFSGTVSLSYGIFDGADTVAALATVTVDAVNDSPVLSIPAPGGDRGVNTYTANHQDSPSLAALADGGWIAVWTSSGQDGSSLGVFAQRYDADGNAAGGEFQVNTFTANSQREPQVAALEDGGYVVTWRSAGDGSSDGIFSQRYDAAGNAAGGELQVNTYTAGSQDSGAVAGLAGGGHVVVWRSANQDGSGGGVYAQAYDASGAAVGGEVLVNSETAGDQDEPAVAALLDGGYVVTWTSDSQDGDGNGVYGQRFDASGAAVGAEFRVNTYTAGAQDDPAIAALADGGFVVAWRSYGQDGSNYGVYLQRYDAGGNAAGSETLVNTHTFNNQLEPSVTGLAGGGYVVTWQSQYQDGSGRGVYAQIYDAAGQVVGGEFLITDVTANDQQKAVVVALADGGFVASWASLGQGGDGNGVFQRVFNADGTVRISTPTFVEDGAAVVVAAELQLGDIDSATLAGSSVAVTDYVQGEDVLAFTAQAGISGSFDAQTGTLTLTGTASVAEYQAVLRSVTYANTSDAPSAGAQGLSRQIAFTVDDGGSENSTSAPVSVTVEIVAVNDAPVVSDSVALETAEDTSLIISEAELLAQSSDPDGDALTVQNLTAASGTLTDNGNGTWTFTPAAGFDGTVALSYQVSDGELTAQASANVEVVAANEAPILTLQAPTGGDQQVNTYTANAQQAASIATLSDGGYVVAWHSFGQDGSGWGIYGQRYSSEHEKLGSEFRVNTFIQEAQFGNEIAALADGVFVITWGSLSQDGSSYGVYAQRYNVDGSAVGTEFRVNKTTLGSQNYSSIIGVADGGFVITWTSDVIINGEYSAEIIKQRYNAEGSPVGSEITINTFKLSSQTDPQISALKSGGYVVIWQSRDQDGSGLGIYGQRYSATDDPIGFEFQVSTFTVGNQASPQISSLFEGGFVVTWESYGQDGSASSIYGQLFDESGDAVGTEFKINTHSADIQIKSDVIGLSHGGFVAVWASDLQDGSGYGIYGQVFDSSGARVGGEFKINSYILDNQFQPAITALPDGGFVVAWDSDGQDGSSTGIFHKIFNADGTERIGPSYVEGSEAVAFAGELTISDVDSTTLVGATVQIDNFVADEDELSFTDQYGISGSFDAQTGVLTLTGVASVAAYEAALRSVGYRNTSDNPSGTGRDISITVDDGTGSTQVSNTVTAHVNVIAVPDGQQAFGPQTAEANEAGVEPEATSVDPASGDLDVFVFAADAGHQVVEDFAAGSLSDLSGDGVIDAIAFDGASGFASFNDVLFHSSQDGGDVVITLDAATSLTLANVQLSLLTADDFRFVA